MAVQDKAPNLGRRGNRLYERAYTCSLRLQVKAEMDESPHVQRWLGKLSSGSHRTNHNRFLHFMMHLRRGDSRFSQSTIAELVDFQLNAMGTDKFEILDIIQRWTKNMSVRTHDGSRDARVSTKECNYWVVHSFFVHNRAALPRDKFIISSETEPTEPKLTLEILKEIVLTCKTVYSTIYLNMFMAGLGMSELLYWSNNGWERLKKEIDEGKTTYTIYNPGRKKERNKRPFRTRTGGDGRDLLLRYIEGDRKKARASFLRSQGEGAIHPDMTFNPNVIFYTNRGTPVNGACVKKYWNRRLQDLGHVVLFDNGMYGGNRYGYHRHLMRSLFATQWSKSPVKNWLADAFMGHVTDPNGYNRAQTDLKWVASEYRKVLPWLNIMTSNRPFELYDEEDIEEIIKREREIERASSITGLGPEMKSGLHELLLLLEHPEAKEKILGALRELGDKKDD